VAVNATAGADRAQIMNLVSAAAGINAARGDVVTVETVAFSTAGAQAAQDALAAAKAEEDAKAAAAFWWSVIAILAVLLVILLALFLYARKNRRQKRELVDLGERIEPVLPLDLGSSTTAIAAVPAPVPVQIEIPPLVEERTDAIQKRAQIEAIAADNPDKTAAYLRGLMDKRQSV
jgi:flagellar M-ring protein FliF